VNLPLNLEKMSTKLAATVNEQQSQLSATVVTVCRIDTPLGTMVAAATDKGLAMLEFGSLEQLKKDVDHVAKALQTDWVMQQHSIHHRVLLQTIRELEAYFAGSLKIFTVPLDLSALGNEFARSVWQTLLQIPYGVTWTYKQQAEIMNNPLAIRAIASANGRNPIAVIVPCHRVIGSNGSLTGYAGGVEKKRWLLLMERNNSPVQAGKLF
jgi:O-6-methylguanine DNA methyltransferase